MVSTIVLPFEMDKLKISTEVKLKIAGRTKPASFRVHLDTGSTDTVMSSHLFKTLGFKEQSRLKVTITGINGKSEGFSTIIDNFIIGGVDLGKTRVTVSDVSPEFKNTIVMGMNVLVWFNMLISYTKGEVTLAERQIKELDKSSRFYRTDIFSRNVLAGIMKHERGDAWASH
ncbi:MAG: retroviral-like aspartic protease family protein [Defluviitaleaceae bacterium]|nr:retroviral-like aspartic protease family protein [Defluviitaleaceae bacterium]